MRNAKSCHTTFLIAAVVLMPMLNALAQCCPSQAFGLVTDIAGAPIQHAQITVTCPDGIRKAETNAAGKYATSPLGYGKCEMVIVASRFKPFRKTIESVIDGNNEIDVTLLKEAK